MPGEIDLGIGEIEIGIYVLNLLANFKSITGRTLADLQEALGRVPEGLLRLSVGLEEGDALWQDLARALARA